MPVVTVQQSPRDIEVTRRLVSGITEAFVDACGIAPENVQVFIHVVDHGNGAKAGILASDRRRAHAILIRASSPSRARGATAHGSLSAPTSAVASDGRTASRVHVRR